MITKTSGKLLAAMASLALAVSAITARAETVDLAHGNTGTISGVPGGTARFDFTTQQPTGTGVIKPFLRVQNTPNEQGYNTSGGTPFDDKAGPWTHDVRVSDLAASAVNIDGVTYFKLLLDANEPGGKKSLVTLDQLQFYTSPVPSKTTVTISALGTLRFSFKAGDYVLLDAARNSGSGSGDMYAYIPASAFTGALPTDYVYMYVFFGARTTADVTTGGGFEEWALVLNPDAVPTPTPTATPTPTPTATPTPTPTAPPRPTPMECDVVAAEANGCYQLAPAPCTSGQAFWFPNADCQIPGVDCINPGVDPAAGTDGFKYVFSPAGLFTEDPDAGTATITGHLESTLHPGYGFDVTLTFSGRTTDSTGGMGPHLELDPGCYVDGGGSIDPSTWYFYANSSGTLIGTGNYAGAIVQVNGVMHYFQSGVGASGKNTLPGSSGWFNWLVVQQPTDEAFCLQNPAPGRNADFNVNCLNARPKPTPVPTPTPTPTPTATPTPTPTPTPGVSLGVGTPGYWQNHPNAICSGSLTLGCTTYLKSQVVRILQNSTSGDMTYQMGAHLAAAKLNISCGNTDASCVSSAIADADAFLCSHPVASKVPASARAWQQISSTFNTLVKYNEGKLCVPSRK